MRSWPHFSAGELVSPDTGKHEMDDGFMEKLEALRVEFGLPMIINSAYRTFDHNAKVGGGVKSAHLYGRAVDIRISGANAFMLISLAAKHGMTGIGVEQNLKLHYSKRYIHLDDMGPDTHPRPNLWSY